MAHEETANLGNTQKKRARTGCLRCRTRRRKCDEHKPRCQRCVHAEAECVYGRRISFLKKNAFTLSSNNRIKSSPRNLSGLSKYSKVQFVDDGHAHEKDIGPNEENQASISSPFVIERESSDTSGSPSETGTGATSNTSIREQPRLDKYSDGLYLQHSGNIGKSQHEKGENDAPSHLSEDNQEQDIGTRQGDGFEIALDVLMTLGTGDVGVDTLIPTDLVLRDIEDTRLSSPPSILKSIDDLGAVSVHVANQLSLGRTIELLRHYRYKIAPWLDLCDKKQTFGLVVPHLAMRSDMLFDTLLNLCTTSYSASIHLPMATDSRTSHSSHVTSSIEDHLEHAKMWEAKLSSVLTTAEGFLINPPQSWEDALTKNNFLPMIYNQRIENNSLRVINERILWLLARLGVAVALFKETTSTINSSLLRTLLGNSLDGRCKSGHTDFDFAHEPLVLCTEVLEFAFGDEKAANSANAVSPKSRAVYWKTIVDNLNDWYTHRPSTFRPVIELSNEEFSFPVMYFTSGAATFSNQLYHASMMLILAHKPRTLKLDQGRSSALSQLWHAQRICGIAMNNNRCECWDPCLLASFYLGARRMTHESQQREVLLGFKSVGSLGWRVDSFVGQLKQEWHYSELLGRD